MKFRGNPQRLKALIDTAIAEDDCVHDITTNALVRSSQKARALIRAKQNAVVCGTFLAPFILRKFDKSVQVSTVVSDGRRVKKGEVVLTINGRAHAILKAERIILNFLSHLSGIATQTRRAVELVKGHKVDILDTRKTTPGLRELEKFAVICGGGKNHRFDLSEMAMVKDNHHACLGKDYTIEQVVRKIRRKSSKKIEIEVENFKQLAQALEAKADIILLDNFSPAALKRAVKLVKKNSRGKKPLLEASGGVTLSNLKIIAQTGVDRISLGALTHSVDAIDFSLDLKR